VHQLASIVAKFNLLMGTIMIILITTEPYFLHRYNQQAYTREYFHVPEAWRYRSLTIIGYLMVLIFGWLIAH